VKTKHIHHVGMLHPFPILKWKCEVVIVDFITKLPRKMKQHDSIMTVVEKFTKVSHLILVKTTHNVTKIAVIYMKEVTKLHGVPKKTISNRDPKFTSILFWNGFFKGFGTNLNINTTY
jgi:hypothetical protein